VSEGTTEQTEDKDGEFVDTEAMVQECVQTIVERMIDERLVDAGDAAVKVRELVQDGVRAMVTERMHPPGPRAMRLFSDVVKGGGVRVHFGGEPRSFVIFGPNEATQLGVMLLQHAVYALQELEKQRVIVPRGSLS
jgi:hypothetical protein